MELLEEKLMPPRKDGKSYFCEEIETALLSAWEDHNFLECIEASLSVMANICEQRIFVTGSEIFSCIMFFTLSQFSPEKVMHAYHTSSM